MLFFTFQSKEAVEMIEKEGKYVLNEYLPDTNSNGVVAFELEHKVGYKPIFVTPIDENNKLDFLIRSVMCCPTRPQRVIIFETDKFNKVNYESWLKLLVRRNDEAHSKLPFKEMDLVLNTDDGFNEYVVGEITKESIKEIINVTDCTNDIPYFGKTISDYSLEFIYSKETFKHMNRYFTNKKLRLLDTFELDRETGERFMKLLIGHLEHPSERAIQRFYNFVKDTLVSEKAFI